jgi:hypothetical protein
LSGISTETGQRWGYHEKGIHTYAAVVISVLPNLMPVCADDAETTVSNEQQAQQKDECILVARNCGNSAISIQDKIDRLKNEIAKGRAIYTRKEMNILQQKLDEVSRTLDFFLDK